ncbi:hypothetical protein [Streptosporangium roseum]|uniref:hypothetical protein n=1 Tax=Streptosporangium roseum TaxID=2001 RepID=UPI0001A3E61E|nr:hypothetical protein [Streptosporangium roseum]
MLRILNTVAAVGSMASAVAILVDPALLLPAGSAGPASAALYAARALPLGAALLYALFGRARTGLLPLLLLAGLAQMGDVVIGLSQHITGMAVGGAVCAAVHLISAWTLYGKAPRVAKAV